MNKVKFEVLNKVAQRFVGSYRKDKQNYALREFVAIINKLSGSHYLPMDFRGQTN